jgi:hypothetical protein
LAHDTAEVPGDVHLRRIRGDHAKDNERVFLQPRLVGRVEALEEVREDAPECPVWRLAPVDPVAGLLGDDRRWHRESRSAIVRCEKCVAA